MTPSLPPGRGGLWDPGAQPERTYQAWTRTGLALAGCALLATRLTAASGVAAVALASFGVIAAVAVVLMQKRRLGSAAIVAAPRSVLAITVLTVTMAVGALALLVQAW